MTFIFIYSSSVTNFLSDELSFNPLSSIFQNCVGGPTLRRRLFEDIKLIVIITRGLFWATNVLSRLPPTPFFVEKLPLKLKFQSALECVGVNLELRSKKLPSILNTDKSVGIQFISLSQKLTPTEVENFLARFSTFRNFFKNVLAYQNGSKVAREPNTTYCTIWVKKNLWSEKVGNSLFSGSNSEILTESRHIVVWGFYNITYYKFY